MLTLYHAPNSRSTSILQLIEEMGVADHLHVRIVTIPRHDGSGAPDAGNPHPEKKVPYLTDGADWVRERSAIMAYLTDRFDSDLGRPVGDPQRGRYLSWLAWYQGVLEPVALFRATGLSHPWLDATFRDMPTAIAEVEAALADQPYLLGERYSAADLLIAGAFHFFGQMDAELIPATGPMRDWIARCQDRPAVRRVAELDAG